MDAHGLLALLESIRKDVPGPLQGAFDDLLQLVRNIVDALDQVLAPPEVIEAGKQRLSTHHETLLTHASTLKGSLDDFQTLYTGNGSNAYFQTAYQAHLQLDHLTDHLSFAMGAHNTISTNLGNGQIAQGALLVCVGLMIPTAVTLPEGTPVMAGEGAGAGFSLAAFWAAMDTIGTALAGLATAALPYIVVGAVALVVVTSLTSDAPQTLPSTITIDLGINTSTWNPGQQQAIADELAGKTKAARDAVVAAYDAAHPDATTRDPKQDPSKAVGAMALLAIYKSDGTLLYENTQFELGYAGADPGDHAEALLIQWAEGVLVGMSGQLAGTFINMLMYTQKVPCAASCRPALQGDTWLKELYDATGQPAGTATVTLMVFASGTGVPGVAPYYIKSTQSGT